MKTLQCHVNAHQRVTLVEEDFNNLVDRMILSVDTSQPLPSHPSPVITQWTHEQSGHGGRSGRCLRGFNHMDFHSQRLAGLWPLLSAHYASSRDQTWVLDMMLFPGVCSQSPGSRFITVEGFHRGRGSVLFLLGVTVLAGGVDPDCQGEIGLPLHSRGKEEYARHKNIIH